MEKRKRPLSLIALSIVSFGILIYIILRFSPVFQFNFFGLKVSVLIPFLLLLFIFLYSFFGFALANKRRGLMVGLITIIYLLLRINQLVHPFFLILLILLFGGIEIFFVKRK